MARAKKPIDEYSLLSIKIQSHKARVGASINDRAKDKRYQHDDLRVYEFDSVLEITGICTYPEDRLWERFFITVYGNQPDREISTRDCGSSMSKIKRGSEIPQVRRASSACV